MRALHLIESEHTRHAAGGLHSFLSISAHAAIVLAALYATTRPAVDVVDAREPRVYFVPEPPRPAAAPAIQAPRPAPRALATQAPAQARAVATAPSVEPATIPAADALLADPSAPAIVERVSGAVEAGAVTDIGQAGRSGPYEAGEVEVAAAALSKSGPAYPERALRLALSGGVAARFIVGTNGRVESEIVILDSTSPEFTEAVRAFLRRTRYSPARVAGRPVRQMVEQRFVFQLTR